MFRRRRKVSDFSAEIEAHLRLEIERLQEQGLTEEQARTAARRAFGNVMQAEERFYESRRWLWWDHLWQDLRFAFRMLRKRAGFTLIAVLSLALGIAANTAIFSAVDNVLLRALPYPNADHLFAVWSRFPSRGTGHMEASAADFYDWRRQSGAFQSLAAYASWPMNLTNVDDPRQLDTQLVSANIFSTLGARAEIGRTFTADEDEERSDFVVVISHHLWRALGESPQIVGGKITLNGSQAIVIGIMPASFGFPSRETDAWVPLSLSAQNRANREGRWLKVIGRVKPGTRASDAFTEMEVISSRLAASYPATNAGLRTELIPLQEELVGKTRPILLTLQAGGFLMLLITCANLANLLLARGAGRAREIAVRAALGASRRRILRQLIVESTLLAVLGGTLGLALSFEGITLIRNIGGGLIPRADEIAFSASVALFGLGSSLLTAMIFGATPALHASRVNVPSQFGSGGRGTSPNVERKRSLLIATEIGLASIVLVGAILMGKSLIRLISTTPGFRPDHVLTMRLTLPRTKYPTSATQAAFFQQVLDLVHALPGIVSAGEVSETPLRGNNPTFEFASESVIRDPLVPIKAGVRFISTGYLDAAGIPLVKGRDFSPDDGANRGPVALINEAMAHRFWPGVDPVGRTVRFKEDQRWIMIVGVVSDIKHMGLTAEEGPAIYLPYAQKTQEWLAWTTLLVRTAGDPLNSVSAVRSEILRVDKNQPVSEIATLEQILSRSTALPRFTTLVIGAISVFALIIALIGVYGLLTYSVSRRLPELSIRMSLGATPMDIGRLLLRQVLIRVAIGIFAGLLGAWWLARLLESMLYGVRPHDPATFVAVAGLLVFSSAAAVIVPARRAMLIDPAAALRSD